MSLRPTPTGTVSLRTGRRRSSRRGRRSWAWGYFFIAPLTLGVAGLYLWPMVQTAYFSFTEWGAFGGQEWVGLDNYRGLLDDPDFGASIRNSLIYTVGVLASIPLGLAIAVLLDQPGLRGRSLYRVIYFLPMVTMPVTIAIIWRWIYNGDYGLLNAVLGGFGIDGPHWITDPATVLIAMIVVGIWSQVGYNIIIMGAALKAIPGELYQAAALDGASQRRQFRSITIPLVSPTTFFLVVVQTMRGLHLFDLVFIMIGRVNPALPDAKTIVYLFYERTFIMNDKGSGAAISVVMLLIILLLTVVEFQIQKRTVHYA